MDDARILIRTNPDTAKTFDSHKRYEESDNMKNYYQAALYVSLKHKDKCEHKALNGTNSTKGDAGDGMDSFGIEMVEARTYPTACGLGYGDKCAPNEPPEITLKNPGIRTIYFEMLSSIIYYDGKDFTSFPETD